MQNERGSILITTIFVFLILLILGFTIIDISATNYSIQSINLKSKRCFYIADGGLDIVYGQLIEEIKTAIQNGKDKLNYFKKKEYEEFIQKEIEKEIFGGDSPYIDKTHHNNHTSYNVNKEKIEEKFNDEFQKGYKNYFLGNRSDNFINNIEKINLENLKINLIDDEIIDLNTKIQFKISSYYCNDRIEKEILSDFYIKVPNKDDDMNNLVEIENWNRRK